MSLEKSGHLGHATDIENGVPGVRPPQKELLGRMNDTPMSGRPVLSATGGVKVIALRDGEGGRKSAEVLAGVSVVTRLADLTAAAWTPVAERVPAGDVDAWCWRLAPGETAVLREAVDAGRVLTAQRRRPDGALELVARRANTVPARGALAPADAAWNALRERAWMARGGAA